MNNPGKVGKMKTMWKNFNKTIICTILLMSSLMIVNSCDDQLDKDSFIISEGVLLATYLEQHPDTFGEFYKILEKTKAVSFLNAYGSYTCFAPNNAACRDFYLSQGKTSVGDFTSESDIEILKTIVRYHIVVDTITSSMFIEGGMPDTTMSGDYLSTSIGDGGINNITINNEARIFNRDILLINGVIHGIDHVLTPIVYTISETLEKNGKYKIFTEVLKKTGLYDSLNMKSVRYTVFAESDSAFNANNIDGYNDLFKLLSQTGIPNLNPTDSLYQWAALHCLKDPLFLVDLQTITYNNMTYKMQLSVNKGITIKINDIVLDILQCNQITKNGIYHTLTGFLPAKAIPVAIYWEISDRREFRIFPDNFRKKSLDQKVFLNTYPDGIPGVKSDPACPTIWRYAVATGYNNRDYLEYKFDAPTNALWWEIETPALVAGGEYKVWICGKSVTKGRASAEVYWDDVYVGDMDMGVQYSGTDEELELINRKLYMNTRSSQHVGFMIGKFKIDKDGTHRIKFVRKTDGPYSLDMMHFIPVNESQTAVKF